MTGFLKNKKMAFYTSLLAGILSVVSVVLYVLCSTGGYYNDLKPLIIILLIGGIAIIGAMLFLGQKVSDGSLVRLVNAVAVGLLMAAFMSILSDRVLSIGFLLFSDLGSDNVTAFYYLYISLAAMGTILGAAVMTIIASFGQYRDQ